MEEGIYFGLPEDAYFAAEGLSCSGMKRLAVSPLNYWHHNVNPDRVPEEDTSFQRIGKAVHCRLLEPDAFADRYVRALSPEDFPGCLVTVDDLKEWLTGQGLAVSAKKKQDLIERVMASGLPVPPIWDVISEGAKEETAGMVVLKRADYDLVERLGAVVEADAFAKTTLSGGIPEVSFFVRHPETGVLLKARMDYVKPGATIDIKTFSNMRCKPTEKVVFDSIYYENYHLQYVVYQTVREIARQRLAAGEIRTYGDVSETWLKGFAENDNHGFGFVFIESDEPFDLRIVELRRAEARGGEANVYWHAGANQMQAMMELYAECFAKYGTEPWRESKPPHVLNDTDIPQLMFA